MGTRRRPTKVVIKGDDAVDFRTAEIERAGDARDHGIVDESEFLDQRVEDGKQRPGLARMARQDDVDLIGKLLDGLGRLSVHNTAAPFF